MRRPRSSSRAAAAAVWLGLCAGAAAAQRVRCRTTQGDLLIALHRDWAPRGHERCVVHVRELQEPLANIVCAARAAPEPGRVEGVVGGAQQSQAAKAGSVALDSGLIWAVIPIEAKAPRSQSWSCERITTFLQLRYWSRKILQPASRPQKCLFPESLS